MNYNPNIENSKVQKYKVLSYLHSGGRLTSSDAQSMFGCQRLASRVSELRKEGWGIKDCWVGATGSKVKQYYMERDEECTR